MESTLVEDDGDPPMLIDSGTESFNASPNTEEEHSQPNTTPVQWDAGAQRKPSVKNILDKSISVDEDCLITPLEPVVCTIVHANNITNNNTTAIKRTLLPLMSILRRASCYDDGDVGVQNCTPRRVSFPDDMATLATYKEPDLPSPFNLCETLSSEEIVLVYQKSCKKHHTLELDVIKTQLSDIKNNRNYTAKLNLSSVHVTMEVCETLEDVFKVANFSTISIMDCIFTNESIREFINLLEYYNSASEYITCNHFRELEAWKMFCVMSSKSFILEAITLDSFANFNDTYMKIMLNNMLTNMSISTLKFNCCNLGYRPTWWLVEALSSNTSVQELYLPQTSLYTKEAGLLGKLLAKNYCLKVLDISNNWIGDRGLEVLAKGLCTQTVEYCGLSVLVIVNNQITQRSGPIISNIIAECKNLHTLNIGFNNLTDEVIDKMEKSLEVTKSLEGLGLQTTLLTSRGVAMLAESIQKNSTLQKINLKGNKAIQNEGLLKLSQALTNTKIVKVELDETNRNCDNPQNFVELVQQINGICTVNKTRAEQAMDAEVSTLSMYFSRKMSLSCEPIYYQPQVVEPVAGDSACKKSPSPSPSPSPIPSPGCSPTARSRFTVQHVPDVLSPPISRFKVVPVHVVHGGGDTASNSPPPDEDLCTGHFANVRSSVSSIESVDSISTNKDSVYDSATPSGESD